MPSFRAHVKPIVAPFTCLFTMSSANAGGANRPATSTAIAITEICRARTCMRVPPAKWNWVFIVLVSIVSIEHSDQVARRLISHSSCQARVVQNGGPLRRATDPKNENSCGKSRKSRSVVCTPDRPVAEVLSLDRREHARGLVPTEESARRRDRLSERPSGGVEISDLVRRHSEVIVDFEVFRKFGGACSQEIERAQVDAAPVEDPAECVGDVRVVGSLLLGDLCQLERLILVSAPLRIQVG